MSVPTQPPQRPAALENDPRWRRALELDAQGQSISAELSYAALLAPYPGAPAVRRRMARLALLRGDAERAAELMLSCARGGPDDATLAVETAHTLSAAGRFDEASRELEALVVAEPDHALGWLLLGQLHERAGRAHASLKAWLQAVRSAREAGRWFDDETTPRQWAPLVTRATAVVRRGQRELLLGLLDDLQARYGATAMGRVEKALRGWLREFDATPADPRQRPRFLYFPDLPPGPYHDPMLQPWAGRLLEAFPDIRAEAQAVTGQERELPDFIAAPADAPADTYVDGDGPAPAWKAFFFYRHGQRHDENHRRAPRTSAVLESLSLCRIRDEAPEILFSVLRPGTHIKPHHGVSNVRLVMHLALVVPPDCALRLVDHGDHQWEEGRLMMFDDTFLHEAWNRSDRSRLILLMDCWNPHLAQEEQAAVRDLVESISGIRLATRTDADGALGGRVMQD